MHQRRSCLCLRCGVRRASSEAGALLCAIERISSGGWAGCIFALSRPGNRTSPMPARTFAANRKGLIISSSRHKTSIDQIHYAEERGFPVMDVAPALNPRSGRDWWILRDNSQAAEALDKVANRLAGKAVSILNRIDLDALVVFGGDTAFAVLQALGKPVAHPIGEVLEGIAVSKVKIGMQQFSSDGRGFDRDLVLITKAGGFGPPNVLPAIRKILTAG